MVYSWPEHSQPQKPFPDLLCVGFGGFYVPWRKCCCSDAIVHENCKFSLNYKNHFHYILSSLLPGFRLLVICWPQFGLEAWGFLVAVVFLFVVLLWNIDYFSSILLWMFIHKRNVFVQVYPHRHCFSFTVAFNKAFLTDPAAWLSESSPIPPAHLPGCLSIENLSSILCCFIWLTFPWILYSYFMVLTFKNKDIIERYAWSA